MYLARAFLNPVSRAVRADLANAVSLHRTVMRAFPDDAGPQARATHGVLHRVDEDAHLGRLVLLVQSVTRPGFERMPEGYLLDLGADPDPGAADALENPAVREVDQERARIHAGDRFLFRLHANATRKIGTKSSPGGAKQNGRRVPVRDDDGRLEWLTRHAAQAGFIVDDVRVQQLPVRSGRVLERRLTFAGVCSEGGLSVTDAHAFREALVQGIGPGKAFGFGLLSIQRVR